jgi:hypothetical protein
MKLKTLSSLLNTAIDILFFGNRHLLLHLKPWRNIDHENKYEYVKTFRVCSRNKPGSEQRKKRKEKTRTQTRCAS